MILRIVLLAAINLTPIEVQSFLKSKGLPGKVKVELIDLSKRELGTQEVYFYKIRTAFLAGKKNTIVITDDFEGYTLELTGGSFAMVACSDRPDRRLHCLSALSHAVGHLKKYKHTENCSSIMDVAALACEGLADLEFKH